jgi:hypothetical protein
MSEKYLMDCWPGKMTMEDVTTWGIDPLIMLNNIFDEYIFNEDDELVFLHYEQKSKLQNLSEVLHRYDLYQMLLERRLKELEPDDPLLKTPAEMVKAEIQRREDRRGQVAIPVKDEALTESERKKRDSRRALRLLTIINDMPKEHTETAESLIRAFFDVPEEKPDIRNN